MGLGIVGLSTTIVPVGRMKTSPSSRGGEKESPALGF